MIQYSNYSNQLSQREMTYFDLQDLALINMKILSIKKAKINCLFIAIYINKYQTVIIDVFEVLGFSSF